MVHRQGQQKAVALQALEEYSDHLMGYPNVVGVGLGENEEEGEDSALYAVKVYVSKKLDSTQLSPDEVIPRHLSVRPPDKPEALLRVPTRVEEIGGEVELEARSQYYEVAGEEKIISDCIDIYIYPQALTPEDTLTDGNHGKKLDITENTLLIWVDFAPPADFAHPTAYVLISATGIRIEEGEWWPVLNGEPILYGEQDMVMSPLKLAKHRPEG
jgi:hypothetical protein